MRELSHNILIENNNIDIEMLTSYFGLLGKDNLFKDHASCDIDNGLIFTTGGFSFSLILSKNLKFSYLILIVEIRIVQLWQLSYSIVQISE